MNAKKILASTRKSLNDYVREQGNKIIPELMPSMSKYTHRSLFGKESYGFGDFLTQRITCRKTGAVMGATAPVIAAYVVTKAIGGSGIDAIYTSVMLTPVSIFTVPIGYGMGYLLDMQYHERKEHKQKNTIK
jgi:hypothetical protein